MTVSNMRRRLKEKITYITPDGIEYNLTNNRTRYPLDVEGWGLPVVSTFSTRGPYQQGETVTAQRVEPRVIRLTQLYVGCDEGDYWSNRDELVEYLRQSRTNLISPVAGKLRRYLPDGMIRQLDVYVTNGLRYSEGGGDHFTVMEQVEFTAYNPIIYDPTPATESETDLACTPVTQLVLPYSPPIYFNYGLCTATGSISITYAGTFHEFPVVIVTGPGENFSITHDQTSDKLGLDYTISAGEVVTFDLTFGVKTVTNNSGVSLLGYLTTDSDLGSFKLLPDPLVSGGLNTFSISIDNTSAATEVDMTYYTRYIGL